MADFFKKLGQSISDTSKNINKSMADSRERSALKKKISDATAKISEIKLTIGSKIYDSYKSRESIDSFDDMCREIDSLYSDVEKYNAMLLKLEGFKVCQSCKQKINTDASFCSHCGAKQEESDAVESDDSVVIEPEADTPVDMDEDSTHVKL